MHFMDFHGCPFTLEYSLDDTMNAADARVVSWSSPYLCNDGNSPHA